MPPKPKTPPAKSAKTMVRKAASGKSVVSKIPVKRAANDPAEKPNSGRQIVAFWKQNDLGLFGRRPDRLISQWIADPSIAKIVVFEMPATLSTLNNWIRLAAQPDKICASEFRLLLSHFLAKHHGELNTAKLTYCSYLQAEEKLNGPVYLRWVLSRLKELHVESPELWLWPVCAINEALIDAMEPRQVTVDFVDDQRLFPGTETVANSYTQQYRWLIKRADRCLSNSEGLIQSFSKEFKTKIALLKNDELNNSSGIATQGPNQRPAKRSTNRPPTVGFVGNMRGRMHISLLQELLEKHRDVQFVFIGQTHGSEFYKTCANKPNAKFIGTLPQREADAIAQTFDLAIIPFVNDALVKSMSPIKAVTFNQLGVPVLSTLQMSESHFEKEFKKAIGGLYPVS